MLPSTQQTAFALGAALTGIIANALGFERMTQPEEFRTAAFWLFGGFVPPVPAPMGHGSWTSARTSSSSNAQADTRDAQSPPSDRAFALPAGHLITPRPIGDRHDFACMRAGLISYVAGLLAVRLIAHRREITNTRRNPNHIIKVRRDRRLVARS